MTDPDPLNAQIPIYRQIAGAMVSALQEDPEFADALVEQVADPKRRLLSMSTGEVLIDCIGVGMRSEPGNRRSRFRTFTTHSALRAKLPGGVVTTEDLDRLGYLSERVQTFFEDLHSLPLSNGKSAKLTESEPFVHVVRSHLFGDGLFVSPVQYSWIYI